MIASVHRAIQRRPMGFVVLVSVLMGAALGLSNATWQASVDTGQVLAGVVRYPVVTPQYLYHVKVFSIANHLGAALLWATGSEAAASVIISCLLGAVSFPAVALLLFALNRDAYFSVIGVAFIYFLNYVGKGSMYPIWLLGHLHTYGILGLAFIVLVLALIAVRAYRAGLLCLGLAPCVHPSMAIWLYAIVAVACAANLRFSLRVARRCWGWFACGMVLSIAALAHQLHLMRELPVVAPEVRQEYLLSFIRHWDAHRQKLFWDYKHQHFSFFRPHVVYCLYSIAAGAVGLVCFRRRRSLVFLFSAIVVSGAGSLLLGALTHVPPDKLPTYLLVLMPARYMNLNSITLIPCLLGMLTTSRHRRLRGNVVVYVIFLVGSLFSQHTGMWQAAFYLILPWLVFLAARRLIRQAPALDAAEGPVSPPGRVGRWRAAGSVLTVRQPNVYYALVLLCFMPAYLGLSLSKGKLIGRALAAGDTFHDRTNHSVYRAASEREGILAVPAGFYMISLKTRRPLLIQPHSLDGFTYVPEAGELFDRILRKVYGVGLTDPPAEKYRHQSRIDPEVHRELWRRRSLRQWREIRKEFGVTDILTHAGWELQLPVVARDDEMILYAIPDG